MIDYLDDIQMSELPTDVLSIIRDYSKPLFPWCKEYNEARVLGLSAHHMEKLKEKMDVPLIREQLMICVDAYNEHKQTRETLVLNRTRLHEEKESKADWWESESREKLCAMLWDHTYRGMNYAYWYFKDEMDDAWMDSDDEHEGWTEQDDIALAEQEAQMKEWAEGTDTDGTGMYGTGMD
jgi:hypothetical protein